MWFQFKDFIESDFIVVKKTLTIRDKILIEILSCYVMS